MKEKGIKLYLVSLGPPDRGTEFAKHTGFPEDQLLADPKSAVYEALSLHNSALDTFFNPKVSFSALCLCRIWLSTMSSCGVELCDMTKQPNHPHSVDVSKRSFIFADPFGLAGPSQEEWRQGNSQSNE